MNRKVVVAFLCLPLIPSVMLGILFVTPVEAYRDYRNEKNDINFFIDPFDSDKYSLMEAYEVQHDVSGIYFDKSIYYPDVRVFWDPNLSVPIEIRVVDRNANDNSVKVNVSSSIDSREVTLTKDVLGVFSGTVFAGSKGLMGEPISNTNSLNVRYGDEIIAEYFDMSSGNSFTASALFVFPHYVIGTCFNNVDSWESASNIVFDSNGIPLVNYSSSIGIQYNPVTISQYALANYHLYLGTGNTTRREKFLAQANWLAENAKQKGNFSVWEYNFDWPSYGCTKPWVSAMAQGEGLSVLARAYVLTGNISYIDVAEEAILAFEVEMSAGGVRYTDSSGVWFEEYADVGAPSGKVLNGFIFALLGLYEYSFETNNGKTLTCFREGVETLSNNIYRYDSGSWSYYDLLYHSFAPLGYHKLHIEQLRTMYELTNDEIFLYYCNKFQFYISPHPPPPPPLARENILTVYTLPSGVTFTVNNASHITPWSGTYENGTLLSLVMPKTYTIGDSRYYWDQWSDGEANQSRTLIMDKNITLAAYFTGPYYQLTVTSSPIIGIVFSIDQMLKPTPYTGWLLEGSYTLEMPEIHGGYVWSHWLEGEDTNRVKTITMDTNISLTAVFTPAPPIASATVDVDPDVLNLRSGGRWITCYIELPESYNITDVEIRSIRLNDTIPVSLLANPPVPVPTEIGDHDTDTIPDLMVKFNRTALTSNIYYVLGIEYGNASLTIEGQLTNGTMFEGRDTVKVILGRDQT